jgi:hypothetical protein
MRRKSSNYYLLVTPYTCVLGDLLVSLLLAIKKRIHITTVITCILNIMVWWHAATLFIYLTLIEHTVCTVSYSSIITLDLLFASAR